MFCTAVGCHLFVFASTLATLNMGGLDCGLLVCEGVGGFHAELRLGSAGGAPQDGMTGL